MAETRENTLFDGAMPKGIGAMKFLEDHPEYDGRGVIVAIFDDGVDPGAVGLQKTSEGKPKILDIIDCTGSGDIDTSKIVTAGDDGSIEAYFGTKLQVNSAWDNPSGKWRVGYKRAFDLFPKSLSKRVTNERQRRLDEHQRTAVTKANDELARNLSSKPDAKSVSEAQKKHREELEERVKVLKDLAEQYKDPGPLIHTVVWQNGNGEWQVALDTSDVYEGDSSKGKLADFKPLSEFHVHQEYGTLSAEDACNFGVHVYDDGDVLSIFVGAGSHGTHVSGITAAYHEDKPYLNGIAPGAQLIVCKIGDTRLGSMETNVGLTRALIQVLKHKADLINLSYGEATATPDLGRFVELANEVVNEHDVIFISSAGNSGPALSSVGAPGGTSSSIISVGAYVDPQLAEGGHSLRVALDKGQQYNWSSRGPTTDGALGVSISAPGGAIAPVPQWTQQSRQLMNGTSMASPCACGGFALILSGLKARGQTITPNRVRRAVENTCLPINSDNADWQLTSGQGLLQVDKAFDLLMKTEALDKPDVRYEVRVKRSDGQLFNRGVYLREPLDSLHPSSHTVAIHPRLKKGADTKQECLAVENKLILKSTADWLTCPNLLLLAFNGRTFEIKVDPTCLDSGVHYAEVLASDSEAEWRGPLFRIPVTLLKPEAVAHSPTDKQTKSLNFSPGKELRQFLAVPEGASWAELRIASGKYDTPKVFMLRASQLLPHTRFSATEFKKTLNLLPESNWAGAFKVIGGATLELTIAQFWSSLGDSSFDIEISYHGLQTTPNSINLDGNAQVKKILLRAPIGSEKVDLKATLDVVKIPLRPSDAVLTPLKPDRDLLPEQKTIHKLELTYKLKVEEAGGHTPTLPALNGYVYDSVVEAESYQIFDSNKKLISFGDIYPEEAKLQKGDYKVRLILRHDSSALLEKFRHLPMIVERKLKDKDVISVSVYANNSAAVKEDKPIKDPFTLYKGERRALFVGPLTGEDKLPKDVAPGRLLAGHLQLMKIDLSGGKHTIKVPFEYSVSPKRISKDPPKVEKEKNGEADLAQKEKDAQKKLRESLRDARVKFLEDNVKEDALAEILKATAKEVLDQEPNYLPVLKWRVKFEDSQFSKQLQKQKDGDSSANVDSSAVVSATNDILDSINQNEVALFFARQTPEEGQAADESKKEMDGKKEALILAYKTQINVYNQLRDLDADKTDESLKEKVDRGMKDLGQWADVKTDTDLALLRAKYEASSGRFAQAVRALWSLTHPESKALEEAAVKLEIELLEKLQWEHWAQAERSRLKDDFPPLMPLL